MLPLVTIFMDAYIFNGLLASGEAPGPDEVCTNVFPEKVENGMVFINFKVAVTAWKNIKKNLSASNTVKCRKHFAHTPVRSEGRSAGCV